MQNSTLEPRYTSNEIIEQLHCLERQLDPETGQWLHDLVSQFSHDFNNRLASVSLSLDLLRRKSNGENEAMFSSIHGQLVDLQAIVLRMRADTTPCKHNKTLGQQ